MSNIGIFYGSTTGNTEDLAEKIKDAIGADKCTLADVQDVEPKELENYDILLLGVPTWDIGELQEDWEDFLATVESDEINLSGKKFGMFGVGDQEGYPDTFGDAIGMVYDVVLAKGTIPIGNKWPTDSYEFEASKGVKDGFFVGLITDEDNQSDLTDKRVKEYVNSISEHL